MRIPFNRPSMAGNELRYVTEAFGNGHVSGDGEFTRRCHVLLEELFGVEKVLLTTSCTSALDLSALLLGVGPGDEVILPSFTFVSTANAFVLRGARPVFVDVRPDTLNLDEEQIERSLSPRTKVIVPVHYAGVACEMDRIREIARSAEAFVVEDNAHGLFGRYKGRALGTFGAFAAQSFHETKNISCGEGGALLINDRAFIERAEILREKGTDRSRFFRGQVDKYTWVDVGSSYLPSDLLAAVLLAQLEAREAIQARRRAIWEAYRGALEDWAVTVSARLPIVPDHCDQPYHLFYLLMPDRRARDAFIGHLKARGIGAVFHYLPLHLSPMGQRSGGRPGDCPVTEDVSDRLVRLPLFNDMTAGELEHVIAEVKTFREAD
ncbi:MAG: dTDP-4-amino-4,6-dideoxygalactose transaminase [Elusimicrobia bacterium]|nr:dTDP-4-amino-4,6-dideoxygalactose transaminase [Elusimicrobiota bacterium]